MALKKWKREGGEVGREKAHARPRVLGQRDRVAKVMD